MKIIQKVTLASIPIKEQLLSNKKIEKDKFYNASIPIKEQLLFKNLRRKKIKRRASIPIKEQLLSFRFNSIYTWLNGFNSYKGTIVIRFF